MTTTEILSAVLSQFPGATLVRRSKTNFIAVPMGENEDGVMEYASIKVGALLSKDTQTNPAFNFNVAKSEYEAWHNEQLAKASKPKAPKKSGADPEKQAAAKARQDALLVWLASNDPQRTATDVVTGLPEIYPNPHDILVAGTDLKALLNAGAVKCEKIDGKNHWSVA